MPRKQKTDSAADLGVRIGKNIKIARTRLGITQSELAEKLDLETVTVSRIETGAQLPSIDRLDTMASMLDVSLVSLLSENDKAGAYVEMLATVLVGLPIRDRKFLYEFVISYANHAKGSKKK